MSSDGEVFAMKNEGLINNRYESLIGGILEIIASQKNMPVPTIWTKSMIVRLYFILSEIAVDYA